MRTMSLHCTYSVHYTLYSLVTLVFSCVRHNIIQKYFGVQGRVVHSSSTININMLINVGGELLLGGAYSDSVFKANSDFSDLYTSIKGRL